MNHTWLRTRNSLEAAALEALDIPVASVSMLDPRSGLQRIDYNLGPDSDLTVPGAKPFRTGQIRADFAAGTLPADHPYRITLAAMHNRSRLLEAQRGTSMIFPPPPPTPPPTPPAAPSFYLLTPGPSLQFPAETPWLKTFDQDRAIALITCGAQIIDLTHDGNHHIYTLTRLTPHCIDLEPLWTAYKTNTVFPALRWHPFGLAIQALHCLRERRKRTHDQRYLTISHRTHTFQGAAVPEHAPGEMLGHVQKTLGVQIG